MRAGSQRSSWWNGSGHDTPRVRFHREAVIEIRPCHDDERPLILTIVNAAAEAYRGVIPDDRWHEPYMPADELDREIASGVVFWGYAIDRRLVGMMGIQAMDEVDLIRHAYVSPAEQGLGVGSGLLEHLRGLSSRPMLVGTWARAEWAIGFYRRHGFELVSSDLARALLQRYWTIPERQIETSVVLANPPVQPTGADPGQTPVSSE
jgi:GNAT superfamily N-acetyltransferase